VGVTNLGPRMDLMNQECISDIELRKILDYVERGPVIRGVSRLLALFLQPKWSI
jgi:hypothetical protein